MAICLSVVAHSTMVRRTVTSSKNFESIISQIFSIGLVLGYRPVLSLVALLSHGETEATIFSNERLELVKFTDAFYTNIKAGGFTKTGPIALVKKSL